MTIHLAPEAEAKVAEMLETGHDVDSVEDIPDARAGLDERWRVEKLGALLDEGEVSYTRGEFAELTPSLVERIWTQAVKIVRDGSPIPSHVRP